MTTLTDTQVITASGGLVELGYFPTALNGYISVTQTAAATGTVICEGSVVCDGSPIMVEFSAANVTPPQTAGDFINISLEMDGALESTYWGIIYSQAANFAYQPVFVQRRISPSAGTHNFKVRASVTNSGRAGTVFSQAGGVGNAAPAFLRVSKIVQATQWPAVTTGTIICTSSTRPASPFEGQTIYETDNSRQLVWDGLGWVAPSVTYRPPMCKASGNTTVPDSSDTTCSFSTEVFDTDGIFSPTSTDFTIQTAGVYLFTAEVNFNGTVNYRGDVYIQKNGSGWRARTTQYGTVERFPVTVADNASVGDVYTVRVYQDNTTNASKTCSVIFSALWQGQP